MMFVKYYTQRREGFTISSPVVVTKKRRLDGFRFIHSVLADNNKQLQDAFGSNEKKILM
jgi:hypothetical protein